MTKLLILDKDGTLTRPKSGAKFVRNPEDQELIPGVKDAIARYVSDGWSLAIASNQGGCSSINPKTGKPFKSIEDAIAEMIFACKLIGCYEAYFCPDAVDSEGDRCIHVGQRGDTFSWGHLIRERGDDFSGFRKPNPGMLEMAIDDCCRKVSEALMVGDRPEDEGAAKAAGIPFLHVDRWLDRSPF